MGLKFNPFTGGFDNPSTRQLLDSGLPIQAADVQDSSAVGRGVLTAADAAAARAAIGAFSTAGGTLSGWIEIEATEPMNRLSGYADDPDTRPYLIFFRSRGTKENPTPTQVNDRIGKIAVHCQTASGDRGLGSVYWTQTAAYTGGNYVRGKFEVWLSGADNDYSPKFSVEADGTATAPTLKSVFHTVSRPAAEGPN